MDGNLYSVDLVEGLRVAKSGGGSTVYKTVLLRESTEAMLHKALRDVQELRALPDGNHRLVYNQDLFDAARLVQHIEKMTATNGDHDLEGCDIDLAVLGKLHPLDVMLISDRVMHIELAAQLRWGLISQNDYDLIVLGKSKRNSKPLSPQELLLAWKKLIDSISRETKTPLDVLSNMSMAEVEATLKNLIESRL